MLVDVVYAGVVWCLYALMCLCDCVFGEMEELILHENWGVWGYIYAGTVAFYVYLRHKVYVICWHICILLGTCGIFGACGELCVY